jgi:enoyl-CoA hydratase
VTQSDQLAQTLAHDLRVVRHGGTGVVTLDRPAKINALTPAMVRDITVVLDEWDQDADLHLILIDGAGPRGFCAGGDIKCVRDSARAHDGEAETFWAEEYRLNAKIAVYKKPVVAFMTGIVMGGGVGLSAHTRHRIVTGSTRLAMPEVGIGLIPDVGATWLFSRAPGETGTYLALTGAHIGAADAIALGFADRFVPDATLETVKAALVHNAPRGDEQVRAIVERFAAPPSELVLAEHRALIDRRFAYDTVEEILEALRSDRSAFALATARDIGAKSPTSLKLTLRALREARKLDNLQGCLRLEYRAICRLIRSHDFSEGIRAAVVDKDRRPNWHPAELGDVSPAGVNSYFASLGAHELRF